MLVASVFASKKSHGHLLRAHLHWRNMHSLTHQKMEPQTSKPARLRMIAWMTLEWIRQFMYQFLQQWPTGNPKTLLVGKLIILEMHLWRACLGLMMSQLLSRLATETVMPTLSHIIVQSNPLFQLRRKRSRRTTMMRPRASCCMAMARRIR
ncbi:hypothetical protein FOPG_16383 [Fusarium oxysporum f. sp. conglutinans race 2 54008]|uniref:Uncharacterized protein n=1 Tax=Fusarium oxysporum f. sp. conglutinans race 2 54008 TaxID=1089457 RepID=X0I2G2_FUSOX|nr:hypothetical protein FOPG_16383 [Fusarium oxysporum f. sp. conglutinans race 2 54008]